MTRVLDSDIAFECAIFVEAQGRDASFFRLLGRRDWRHNPLRRLVDNQSVDTFDMPERHAGSSETTSRIEELPVFTNANGDNRPRQRAGNLQAATKKPLAPVRQQGNTRL